MKKEVRRFERRLAHAPEKVWRALTKPEELARWFPAVIDGERAKGAALRFTFPDGESPAEGTMTECDPPRVLAYTMGAETLRWELQPADGGTRLVFTTEVREEAANDSAIEPSRARLAA